ncbi:MAG: endolytic transglycosylase MltG [Desulfovibrio sp.]|jgi:UPF0755 protein|nr:endolytic transglycosylase MltG [Desulfovibrio sp.]
MKTAQTVAGLGLIALVALALWIWREAHVFLNTPPQSPGVVVYFDVAPGANDIAAELAKKGIVTDAEKFSWLTRLTRQDKRLQAGYFALNTGWLPEKVLDELVNGRPALYRITLPEGLTWWQTGRLLESAGFVRFEDFRDMIADVDFLRRYGIPFTTAEGFLMPDTYLLKKPDGQDVPDGTDERVTAWSVAGRLVDNFWRKAASAWPDKIKPDTTHLKQWVILASIVEKETALDAERARVAGVYTNRLEKRMLLQADPTVIYGLGATFDGNLRRRHLDDAANLYNTYQRLGLPPGPICSFGVAALSAAVRPERHNFLYFVAVQDGGAHEFTTNLTDHNRAVQRYLQNRRSAR